MSKSKETPVSTSPAPIWPISGAVNEGEIQGTSPLPIIWLIGEKATGKSRFIATLDPQKPGEKSRTLVTDQEGSFAALRHQFALEVVDTRALTIEKYGEKYSFKQMFEVWRDFVTAIEPGRYTVLGVDPASDLYIGAFQWVKDNAAYFQKVPGAYNGEKGTKFAWGDAAVLWKQILTGLASKVQTIVLTSHTKTRYENDVKTKDREARGADFMEVATLALWMAKEDDPQKGKSFWAKVVKSRLSHNIWENDKGEMLEDPITVDMLPTRLVPERYGQTYKALIKKYMLAPQPSYGDLDSVSGYDPEKGVMSAEERELLDLEKLKERNRTLELEMEMERVRRRDAMCGGLINSGLYKNMGEIVAKVRELGLSEKAKQISEMDEVEAALRAAKAPADG